MSSEKTKIRILIVEDHPIFRMGMRDLINQETDMMVCGEADDVAAGRKAIDQLQPDIVIVDLSLKSSCGIDLVREARQINKKLPVLVLSMHDESLHAERCILAGARGYIMKQETSEFVVKAIRQILDGHMFISQKIMGNILNKFQNRPDSIHKSPIENLTDREMEVFRLIGKGYSSGKIAGQLHISVKTVGTYRERIKEKLGLKHGGDLVKYAVLWVETDIFEVLSESM